MLGKNAIILRALVFGIGLFWFGLVQAMGDTSNWIALWQNYQKYFISSEGRVVDYAENSQTTSEGQSYALFFSLVSNNKPLFSQILDWTQNNLAGGSLAEHLPDWRWGKAKDGKWGPLSNNSASDADIWTAYTLIEAGRLWNNPQYTALGKLLAQRIVLKESADIPHLGVVVLPGKIGFHPKPNEYILNMSYFPLPVIQGLATNIPGGPWLQLAKNLPTWIKETSPKGFTPDWSLYKVGSGFTVAPEGPNGSYNAIRVYLWAGLTNPKTKGYNQILTSLDGMNVYFKTHLFPPLITDTVTGISDKTGPVGFSASVIPFLKRLDLKTALNNQKLRLAADLNTKTGLYGEPPRYYDQNLALFALGWENSIFSFTKNGNLKVPWSKE